jgi:PTS system nitrogen regulatory IIA component
VKIAEFLKPESIISELSATTKAAVLTELSASLSKALPAVNPQRLSQVLEEREKVASTGIGEGVAIPHGKLPGITTLSASFGVSRNGIEFDAIDRKPTHLFFALVAPENSAGLHLKALARISRLFKNPTFRASILAAQSAGEIYALIAQEDAKA